MIYDEFDKFQRRSEINVYILYDSRQGYLEFKKNSDASPVVALLNIAKKLVKCGIWNERNLGI